jgi:hypothetical protein
MNRLRFVDLHSYKFGTSEVPTLENFKDYQAIKRKQIQERISEFSKRARDNIRNGINSSLEILKKNNYKSSTENDLKKDSQNVFKLK